jgi:hypothetical protein
MSVKSKSQVWLTKDNTPVSPGLMVWTPGQHIGVIAASNFERIITESGVSFRLTREHSDGYVRVAFNDGSSATYSCLRLVSAEKRR